MVLSKAETPRMAKRHARSVHREGRRPQGSRSPLKQFNPVRSVLDADGDGVNVTGSQHRRDRDGEIPSGPSGFEAVACDQRSDHEPGRPARLPARGRTSQLTEGGPTGGQESDPLVVLRDGRAVHTGKRRAGWTIEQRTHVSELYAGSSRVTLPALGCCCATVQRSPVRDVAKRRWTSAGSPAGVSAVNQNRT